jgi:hypothetical protein
MARSRMRVGGWHKALTRIREARSARTRLITSFLHFNVWFAKTLVAHPASIDKTRQQREPRPSDPKLIRELLLQFIRVREVADRARHPATVLHHYLGDIAAKAATNAGDEPC